MNTASMTSKAKIFILGLAFFIGGLVILASYSTPDFQFFPREDFHVKLREAQEYLKQNSEESAKEALRLFNQILANDISERLNQQAKYGIAATLERLGENAAALEYYRELQQSHIDDPQIRNQVDYALGRFYLYLDYELEGRSLLNPLLSRIIDAKFKSKIYSTYGMYYLSKKEIKRAEANFRVALKYDQENLEAEHGRAKAVKGQGRDWAAYRYYDDYIVSAKALEPDKVEEVRANLADSIFNSGIQAFRDKRYRNATSFFYKAFEKAKQNKNKQLQENALFWLAESYRNLSMNKKAYRYYDSVLKNDVEEKDAVSLFRKGTLLFQANQEAKAVKIFSELHNQYPSSEYSSKAKEYLDEYQRIIGEEAELEEDIPLSDAPDAPGAPIPFAENDLLPLP